MSLSGAFSAVVDDLCEALAPIAGRAGGGPRRVAAPDGDALALYEAPRKGEPRKLPSGKRGAGPAELRLPANLVMTRALTLPAAGRDFLEPIIEHRLERLVPWAADRVLYGYRVTGDAPNGELAVDFAATSRDLVEPWLARAEALGVKPTALGSAAGPLDAPLAIDLWRGARDPGRTRLRRAVVMTLASAALLLPALLGGSWWATHSATQRLEAVEARSTAARRTLRLALGGGPGSPEQRMIAAKTPDGSMTVLIDRLSELVPADTVLRALEIDGERIRLAGVSAAATALIPRLEGSGVARDPRFAAPVVRGPDNRDGFEILAQRARPAPAAEAGAAAGSAGP